MLTINKENNKLTIKSDCMGQYKNKVLSLCSDYIKDRQGFGYSGVMVVIRELLTNAIVHGCQQDGCGRINLTIIPLKNCLYEITISDSGQGFDHSKIKPRNIPEDPREIKNRGYLLIYQLSQKVTFNKRGNCITAQVAAQ